MTTQARPTPEKESGEITPPLNWFTGIGKVSDGILVVMANEHFASLRQGEVGQHWQRYKHYIGNPTTGSDTDERRERAEKAISDADTFITATTGFKPETIREREANLTRLYRGKKTAPFEVKLL